MKKVFSLLLLAVTITAVSYGQSKSKFSYKLGILTSVPTDADVPQTSIGLGSTLGEVSYKLSNKVSATGTLGYTRYKDAQGTKFSQIPVSVGARYAIDSMFHFGATAGLAFYGKSSGTDFVYTPYIGLTVKKVTFNIHYFNTVKTEPIKLLALVFSYTL